jgi:hypothetical protein
MIVFSLGHQFGLFDIHKNELLYVQQRIHFGKYEFTIHKGGKVYQINNDDNNDDDDCVKGRRNLGCRRTRVWMDCKFQNTLCTTKCRTIEFERRCFQSRIRILKD